MKGFLSSGADGSKIGVVLVFFLAVPPLASAACAPNNLQLILPNRVSDGTKSTTQFQALGNGFPDTPVPKLFDLNGAVTIGTVISSSTFEIDFSVPTTTLFAPGVYQGIIGNADVNCPSSVSKQVVSNFSKANFPALGETSVPSTAQAKDQFLGFERDLTKNSAIETRSAFGGASEGIYEIAGLGAHAFEDWMRNRGPSQIAADLVNCSGPGTLPLLQIIENPSFRLLGGSLNRCTDYVGGEDSPVDPYWEAVRAKVRKEREAKARSECANNLKQSGIAIRSYSDLFCSEDPYYFVRRRMTDQVNQLWPSTEASVNLVTGNLFTKQTFLHLASLLPTGLDFTIYYNSQAGLAGPFGLNTSDLYHESLDLSFLQFGFAVWVMNDGNSLAFFNSGGTWSPIASGAFGLTFQQNADSSFTVRDQQLIRHNFSQTGKLGSIADANGNKQTVTRDGTGNVGRVDDTTGRFLSFKYLTNSVEVTDNLGRKITVNDDASGNLTSVIGPDGNKVQYGSSGNVLNQVIDANGHDLFKIDYDTNSFPRVKDRKDGTGNMTFYRYNGTNTQVTRPMGDVTQWKFDSLLRLQGIIDTLGNSVTLTSDANNLVTDLLGPQGQHWHNTYDGNGNPIQVTDPANNSATAAYNSNGKQTSYMDRRFNTTRAFFDAFDRLIELDHPDGGVDRFTRTAQGQERTWTNPNNATTFYSYDASGNRIRRTDPMGGVEVTGFDGAGRPVTSTDELSRTERLFFDPYGRMIKKLSPLENATSFGFDAAGNPITSTDAGGNITTRAYDGCDRLVTVTLPTGGTTTRGYNANSAVTSITNSNGGITTFGIDGLDRITTIRDPLNHTSQTTFDASGNVIHTVDENLHPADYTYDALGRKITETHFDGTAIARSYDAEDNLLSMTDSTGTTTYAYDSLDRRTVKTLPGGGILRNVWDLAGNRISQTLPDGQIQTYGYDALNRMGSANDGTGTTFYNWDAASQLRLTTLPNQASTTFTYDADGRQTLVVNRNSTTIFTSYNYVYDSIGRKIQTTNSTGGVTLNTYDRIGQLVNWKPPSGQATAYVYDSNHNRIAIGASNSTYDAADELINSGGTALTYDNNGNQIGDGLRTYGYDALGQMATVSGATQAQYRYDGEGLRVSQQVSAGTYQYVYDSLGRRVVQENGPDGNIIYTHGLGLISAKTAAWQLYYQYDGSGNVVTVTDGNGNLKMNYTWDPWGKFLGVVNSLGNQNKYRFAGEATDPGTGFIYMNGRYYSPVYGRYIGKQGAGFPNPYIYKDDNPIQ